MIKKPPKRRFSSQYREWLLARIRTGKEACPICGEPATEGHHEGPHSAGRKPDDFWMVPLCNRCHRMRHDVGVTAWLDMYRSTTDPDGNLHDMNEEVRQSQARHLRKFIFDKTGTDFYKLCDWKEPRHCFHLVKIIIEWIEARHPDWIQDRPKRTSLGKRKRNKRGGCRPLTKKIESHGKD